MLKITETKIDHHTIPLGVGESFTVDWKITNEKKNTFQTSYEIQIAEDDSFSALIFQESRKTSDSIGINIANLNLSSLTKYFLRIRITDNYGEISEWNKTSFVTTILSEKEWKASFISAEKEADADFSNGTYITKKVSLTKKVKTAYALTTALGLYHFYINGKKIGIDQMAPGWTSYKKRLLYQIHEVSSCFTSGENSLSAHLGAGWYKGKMGFVLSRNIYGKQTAFFCQIQIEYEDGTKEIICSDDSWKGHDSPVIFSEIYDGEIYDARKEISDWNLASCKLAGWHNVLKIEYPLKNLQSQVGCKNHVMESFLVKEILKTPQGDTVIDFGQNLTGWISFTGKGKKNDVIELNCFEVLSSDGNAYFDNLRTAKETIKYTVKDDSIFFYHPLFSYQGFRYVRVKQGLDSINIKDFTAHAIYAEMEETSTFVCSNGDLNQLHHNIIWGMKGNFLDLPTDCPQRDERMGWTGDAQIFCRTANTLMDAYLFYSKWLKDLSADQRDDGGIPHVIPDILSIPDNKHEYLGKDAHSAAAWADASIICPWTLYLVYGDKKILIEQYDSMKMWVDFMHANSQDGIWNYALQFGDWLALDASEGSYLGATPNELTCTAFCAYTTGLFVKIAHVLGHEEVAIRYQKIQDEIVNSFRRHFFFKDGTMTVQTQTAHILALYFNLVPNNFREKTVDRLVELLAEKNGHLVTGFVGTPYFCHALSQNGKISEAYELLLKTDFPSWLYQVKQGATTVWEHWDGLKPDGSMWSADMNSFNHYAYGAVGDWLYRAIAGIEIDEKYPGYKHFFLSPKVGGNLKFALASIKTVYGKIISNWSVNENTVSYVIEIPVNTTVDVTLINCIKILDSSGLDFTETEKGLTAVAGSGSYTIVYLQK